jgi:hypothetical protein
MIKLIERQWCQGVSSGKAIDVTIRRGSIQIKSLGIIIAAPLPLKKFF